MSSDQLLIIVNPESGDKQCVIDIAASVLPLLKGISYQLRLSESEAHVRTLTQEFIESGEGTSILIAGGDGTVHEVINGLVLHPSSQRNINIVLWPGGTANALYASLYSSAAPNAAHQHLIPPGTDEQTAYKLKSLLAYLHSRSTSESEEAEAGTPHPSPSRRQLTLAATEIFDENHASVDRDISVVVSSTSLHAAILHTAEELRATVPGLARFKQAAEMNLANWTSSQVSIFGQHGRTGRGVQQYDVDKDELVQVPGDTTTLELDGPFSYFLSTVNVDRLEPTFYITAPFTTHPPEPNVKSMEIVILRPARSPLAGKSASLDTQKSTREEFGKAVAMKALMAAYDGGRHVKERYGESGEAMVEYFRAAGWEWKPTGEDEASRLICVDGTVKKIPIGGHARCQVLSEGEESNGKIIPGFSVLL